ncbi:alpha/beta fold hydrolase [Larkinella sp. VNQ87]|uniref:alpha/beta fold hydrolase n=1 Tax=Larkinella sp. VNQ87 TaxID=3400921 RepID=UPI003C086147
MKRLLLVSICLFIPAVQAAISKPIGERLPWVEKRLKISDELTLDYVEQGSAAGIPVVFLHGYSDSWHSYEGVLAHLPRSVHAYVLSQRGHGNSSRPASGYHPDDFADDVAAFMNKLGIREATIVGHSLGGTIAQSFATRYPKKSRALVLVGSFADYRKPVIDELSQLVATLKDPVDSAFVRDFQQSTLVRPVSKTFFAMAVQESMKLPAYVWRQVMEGIQKSDYTESLKHIRIPTLLVWGDRDQFAVEQDQQKLNAVIAGSKRLTYTGTGHSVHWEDPEQFAKDLLDFLALLDDPIPGRKPAENRTQRPSHNNYHHQALHNYHHQGLH